MQSKFFRWFAGMSCISLAAAAPSAFATQFAADAWGAWMLIANAMPQALKTAKPGTVEFRTALRAALENTRDLTVPQGVINMTGRDHVGLDQRSRVMGRIQGGRFTYAYGG